jgi:DNA repair photolyase
MRSNSPKIKVSVEAKVISVSEGFAEKQLSDGLTFSAGNLCRYSCAFCYVPYIVQRNGEYSRFAKELEVPLQALEIRKENPVEAVREQIKKMDGIPKFKGSSSGDKDNRVIFGSPLVDVAATVGLAKETAKICQVILEMTDWHIRLLSKSNLLHIVEENIVSKEEAKARIIYGVSTGTLHDDLALAFEVGTARPSKRVESIRKLQDRDCRTYGMLCPSLPMESEAAYQDFSEKAAKAIRADRCEHVWAEPLNLRGNALKQTLNCLLDAKLKDEAKLLDHTFLNEYRIEKYTRDTFLAHKDVFGDKLRFLVYPTERSRGWWSKHQGEGALLLGKNA